MLALLTSCGRPDLLSRTVKSFYRGNTKHYIAKLIIHEDSKEFKHVCQANSELHNLFNGDDRKYSVHHTDGVGQHKSIDQFLFYAPDSRYDKYYMHLEEDWEFLPNDHFIRASIAIMEKHPEVIKVLARKNSPHPCIHDHTICLSGIDIDYGFIKDWTNPFDGRLWHGFSWNPGVTRLDLLRKFYPLPAYEQDVDKAIMVAGYKVVELSTPVYDHIGFGRSTHN